MDGWLADAITRDTAAAIDFMDGNMINILMKYNRSCSDADTSGIRHVRKGWQVAGRWHVTIAQCYRSMCFVRCDIFLGRRFGGMFIIWREDPSISRVSVGEFREFDP